MHTGQRLTGQHIRARSQRFTGVLFRFFQASVSGKEILSHNQLVIHIIVSETRAAKKIGEFRQQAKPNRDQPPDEPRQCPNLSRLN